MSSSDLVLVTMEGEIQPTCHFMRLPTEVREMIYRPLVIARYAMVEHRMNSREYDRDRRRIQNGPDQEYWFETAILATNRRIHQEVRDLCRRENDFVCLTSRQPSCLGFELEKHGLQMVAKLSRARSFWNISMTLTLDPPSLSGWPQGVSWSYPDGEDPPKDGRPWTYIFCSEELPEFCRLLLDLCWRFDGRLEDTVLYINISAAIANEQAKVMDNNPPGRARIQKLLGPLRRLHSLGAAQIDGPLSDSYKSEIVKSICKNCPTTMVIIHETIASLEQADDQASKDQIQQALLGYKAALSFIRSVDLLHPDSDLVMSDGPFPGLEAREVVGNIKVRLQARIAAAYYKINELRMARIYTERALDPRRACDRDGTIPHQLDIGPWEHIVYAEVLHVAAMISYLHGNVQEAIYTISQAGEYVPFDEEQESRHEAWQAHADKLRATLKRKYEARDRKYAKRIEEAEGTISQQILPPNSSRKKLTSSISASLQVVYNWKRKGEGLFRSGRSYLAASVFQTALKKLEMLDRNHHNFCFLIKATSFQQYSFVDTIRILAFRIEACLAAANLKSRNYKEVVAQTYSTLNCDDKRHSREYQCRREFQCHRYCRHSYWDSYGDWAEDRKFDYLRIHYCRAMALYRLGDAVAAVEHMEEALRLDPGDNDVFEKLTMLKQNVAKEEAARKQRLEKLNRSQHQLRLKQARRRERK